MNYSKILLPVLAAIVACALTRYYWPRVAVQLQTKTIVQTDVHTVTRVIERPDGSKETVIDSTDRSTKDSTKTATKFASTQWHVSLAALSGLKAREPLAYQLEAQRRILGPIYIGALLSSAQQVGLSIGMEF